MLNQASGDRQILAKQLNISPTQLSYVTNSNEGEGLLFYGNVIIPFVDRFPEEQAVSVINDPPGRDGRSGIGGKTMHVLAYFLTFTAGMVCGLVLTCIVQAGKK